MQLSRKEKILILFTSIVMAVLLCLMAHANAATTCNIIGNTTFISGAVGAGTTVTFSTPVGPPQNANGTIIPFSTVSVITDSNGLIPANSVNLPYSAIADVQICSPTGCSNPFTIQVPKQNQVDLDTLYLAQNDPPSLVSSITCQSGCTVVNPPPGAIGTATITVSGGGGAAFPLTADVSANNWHIQLLAPDASTGDALSRGNSPINSLKAATGPYSMNGFNLRGLAAVTSNLDAESEGNPIGAVNPAAGTFTALQANNSFVYGTQSFSGNTVAPDNTLGPLVVVTRTSNAAWSISNLANPKVGGQWNIDIFNNSGGAIPAPSMGGNYITDQEFAMPANGSYIDCRVSNRTSSVFVVACSGGANTSSTGNFTFNFGWHQHQNAIAETGGTAITPDLSTYNAFDITVGDSTPFTINNPTNMAAGDQFEISIFNNSGGVMGNVTFGGQYHNDTFTKPASTKYRLLNCHAFSASVVECGVTLDI